jgi:hypothetical protein
MSIYTDMFTKVQAKVLINTFWALAFLIELKRDRERKRERERERKFSGKKSPRLVARRADPAPRKWRSRHERARNLYVGHLQVIEYLRSGSQTHVRGFADVLIWFLHLCKDSLQSIDYLLSQS